MSDILERLELIVQQRRGADPDVSYIAKRLKQGTGKIAQKFGEESVETVIAAMTRDKKEIINESADMIFHWLMLLNDGGVSVAEVMD